MEFKVIEDPKELESSYENSPALLTGPLGTKVLAYKDLVVLLHTSALYSKNKDYILESNLELVKKFFPNHKHLFVAEDKYFTKHIES